MGRPASPAAAASDARRWTWKRWSGRGAEPSPSRAWKAVFDALNVAPAPWLCSFSLPPWRHSAGESKKEQNSGASGVDSGRWRTLREDPAPQHRNVIWSFVAATSIYAPATINMQRQPSWLALRGTELRTPAAPSHRLRDVSAPAV
jgi:hypothetical protein